MAGRKTAPQKFSAALGSTRTHNARVNKKSKASAKSIKHKNSLLADDLDTILVSEGLLSGKSGKKFDLVEPTKDMEVDSAVDKKEEKKKSGNVEDLLDQLKGM